jgi:hypothetical protein
VDFDEWWMCTGRWLDPEPGRSGWYDKRKVLMAEAWVAAITFANGGSMSCQEERETAPDRGQKVAK